MPPPFHRPAEPETGTVFSAYRLPAADGAVRLMLVGELDLVTAERADDAIRAAQEQTRALVCDLGDVWFVDLSGLRVLLDAAAHARWTGARFTIACCPPIVPRMLQLLGLGDRLDLRASLACQAGEPRRGGASDVIRA